MSLRTTIGPGFPGEEITKFSLKKKINNILIVIHLQANVRGIMPEEMGKTFRLKRNPLRAQSGRIMVLIQLHI